ncbi:MAG: hypothetical protein K6G90_00650 [Clostridia bacterium]|nr:hypothetical protein [Clostridia bacterium]
MFLRTGGSADRNDVLISCSVSTGGGMLGGYRTVSLEIEDSGEATLTVREKETHADREITTVYSASPDAADHIREIINRCDLYNAGKQPYSKMRAMDAETTTLSFRFKEDSFSISGEQVLSKKMSEGFREVIDYMDSLAVGEGDRTVEPQIATLYLENGYTLYFTVADAFDGKLDEILSEETKVSAFEDCGIVVNTADDLDITAAEPSEPAAGSIVYDPESGQIIILYADHDFGRQVFTLAVIEGDVSDASPLISGMEGTYSMYLN